MRSHKRRNEADHTGPRANDHGRSKIHQAAQITQKRRNGRYHNPHHHVCRNKKERSIQKSSSGFFFQTLGKAAACRNAIQIFGNGPQYDTQHGPEKSIDEQEKEERGEKLQQKKRTGES